MKTVILAGGLGTRMGEETEIKPKPMIGIGGTPLLSHIMSIYTKQGFNQFIIAAGYKQEIIRAEYPSLDVVDTGLASLTGSRLKQLEPLLSDTFFMTYGDGLANLDIHRLLAFHLAHRGLATVTAVHPPARFGGLSLMGDRVQRFTEKPQAEEGWINGGFFVLNKKVLDYIDGNVLFEREPL